MRLFGSDGMANFTRRFRMEEGQPIEHKWLNRSIETAQRRVEQHNYSIRKRTLEYDDVMNKQREIIYGFRSEILSGENTQDQVLDIMSDIIDSQAHDLLHDANEESVSAFTDWVNSTFPIGWKTPSSNPDELTSELLADSVFN